MRVGVVIPAYNESGRLPGTLAALAESVARGEFSGVELVDVLVVDDGSSDETHLIARPPHRALRLDRNRGKGAAVRTGVLASTGDWVLIADADQSTPWSQLNRLVESVRAAPETRIAIGSRGLDRSRLTRRQSPLRESLGKLFNRLITFASGLPFKDTQCGFKLVQRASVVDWIDKLTIDRFAWDVEFLLEAQARKLPIIEVPVHWRHEDGSKVRLFRDGARMVFDFLKIRAGVRLRARRLGTSRHNI